MKSRRGRKIKLFREDVKDRHTSHWDLDLLSREDLERLMAADQSDGDDAATESTRRQPDIQTGIDGTRAAGTTAGGPGEKDSGNS